MGCCFSKGSDSQELELGSNTTNAALTCRCGNSGSKVLIVNDSENYRYEISGSGTVVGSCPLDCDTARWEVVIAKLPSNGDHKIHIGVKRYNAKANIDLSIPLDQTLTDANSPSFIFNSNSVKLKEGDVVGIFWDQTDLPMLSFSVNGKLVADALITRIRPSSDMYPALSLSSGGGPGKVTAHLVFDENGFKYPAIASKFKMIICSSSLI